MDGKSVLTYQIKALVGNLQEAERVINAPNIPQDLRQAVQVCFGSQIIQKRRDLQQVLEGINHYFSPASWQSFQRIRKDCQYLLSECLAFLEGALIRGAQLDEGLCEVADRLLKYLSDRTDIAYSRFTLLAEGEFLSGMTDIIRLRFPEFNIWEIPIIGHEFGHFVAQKHRNYRPTDPFQKIVEMEGKQKIEQQDEDFLYEYFADIFATYALGPAFACTSILLRFTPENDEDHTHHPSNSKRVYFILNSLDKVSHWNYKGVIDYFTSVWQNILETAGIDVTSLPDFSHLKQQFNILYDEIDRHYPLVCFSQQDWSRAQSLSQNPPETIEQATRLISGTDTLPIVLNTAWLWRINYSQEDERKINQIALKLCREVMQIK